MKLTVMWVSLVLLIIFSAFFSSSETAISSMNRIRMKHLYEQGNKKAGIALNLADNYNKTLTAILIGNNIVNIAASTIGTLIFTEHFGAAGAGISTLFLTVAVLIFGEVTPKGIAKDNANKITIRHSRALSVIVFILTPFIYLFDKLRELISGFTKKEDAPSFTEQELKVIIGEVQDEGVLEANEGALVKSALDFDETTAEEAMVPRVDMVAIESGDSLEKIKDTFIKTRFSRIPVYEGQVDNIIGILSEKSFMRNYINKKKFSIKKILDKPLLIPPQTSMTELLQKYRAHKTHMALVIDQYGGVDGLITLENVFGELVGNVSEKGTKWVNDVKKTGNNTYVINPDISCDDMFERIGYKPPDFKTAGNTVGGWVLEMIKKAPDKGDSFVYDRLKVLVLNVKGKRMTKLKVAILEPRTSQMSDD